MTLDVYTMSPQVDCSYCEDKTPQIICMEVSFGSKMADLTFICLHCHGHDKRLITLQDYEKLAKNILPSFAQDFQKP